LFAERVRETLGSYSLFLKRQKMIQEKDKLIEDLVPIYKSEISFLVTLKIDIPDDGSFIKDSLILNIKSDGTYSPSPWSGQKTLKFGGGYYEPIPPEKRKEAQKKLFLDFSNTKLQEIRQLLIDPPIESIESLIYISTRLKKKNK
jgi:hypothetical protein